MAHLYLILREREGPGDGPDADSGWPVLVTSDPAIIRGVARLVAKRLGVRHPIALRAAEKSADEGDEEPAR